MLQRFTHYLLNNRWQAIALTFLISFVPLLGVVGILIAALMTLMKGVVEGAIFMIAATIPCIISFYFSSHHDAPVFLLVWTAVSVTVISNILTWILAVLIYRKSSLSTILQVAALSGVLVISLVHLAYPNVSSWWGGQLKQLQMIVDTVSVDVLPNDTVATMTTSPNGSDKTAIVKSEKFSEMISMTKQYATGFLIAAILFNAMIQAIVARWWQSTLFSPGKLRRELHHIRLSQLAGVSFAVSIILFYFGNSVLLDIMPVLYLLFAGAGLSLIHYFFGLAPSKNTWFWMLLFYVAFVISMPVSIFLLAILALLDIWLDIRKRFKKV